MKGFQMQRIIEVLHLEAKFLRRKYFPLPSADCRLCSESVSAQLCVAACAFLKAVHLRSRC